MVAPVVQLPIIALTLLAADPSIRKAVLGDISERALRVTIIVTILLGFLVTGIQVLLSKHSAQALPPRDFLVQFQLLFAAAHTTEVAAHAGALRPDELEGHARHILQHLADVVKQFLNKPDKSRFSANVMLYRNQQYVQDNERELQPHLRFVEEGVSAKNLERGVLELMVSLSAEMSGRFAGAPQTRLPTLVLPVHSNPSWALPGAPEAFHDRIGCTYYEDTHRIGERCRRKGIAKSVARAVEKYFKEDLTDVRSFFSVALVRTRDVEEPGGKPVVPLGVVNVNCSEPRMLKSERQQEMLLPHVTMITYLLAEIIHARFQNVSREVKDGSTLPVGSPAKPEGMTHGRT